MSTQMGWNDYSSSRGYWGNYGNTQTDVAREGVREDLELLYDIPLPYWLRIGPITWEGKY